MELDISVNTLPIRCPSAGPRAGTCAKFTDSQVRSARRLIDGGQTGTQVAKDLGMSRATLYRRMAEIQARERIRLQSE